MKEKQKNLLLSGYDESQSSQSSATGNPEHYSTSMVDTLPKFDPTGDSSSLAIAKAMSFKPGIKAQTLVNKETKGSN